MAVSNPLVFPGDFGSHRLGVIGGGVGTGLMAGQYSLRVGGCDGFVDVLCEKNPSAVGDLHRKWLAAGVDWLLTNSFLCHPQNLARFGWEDRSRGLAFKAASIARGVVDALQKSSKMKPLVVGSVGPLVVPLHGISKLAHVVAGYLEFATGLLEGGVDVLCLESFQDTATADLALGGCRRALEKTCCTVPIGVSFAPTFFSSDGVSELARWAETRLVDMLGLNCGSGPVQLAELARSLAACTKLPLIVYPNAGLPELQEGRLIHPKSPSDFVAALGSIVCLESVIAVGGCCGSGPKHFEALSSLVSSASVARKQCNWEEEV